MRLRWTILTTVTLVTFIATGCAPAAPVQAPPTTIPPTPPLSTPLPPDPNARASSIPSATEQLGSQGVPAGSPAPSSVERVKLDDITMYYAAYGEGEPLILLHNGASNADTWAKQVPEFAKHYRVITPDLRGQGRTTDGEVPLTYELMATDTLRLMNYLKIDKAYVVGWNFGAVTGLELAMHHPERVRALVAYGPYTSPEGWNQTARGWFQTASQQAMRADMDYDYTKLSPAPDHLPVILEKIRTLVLTQPNIKPGELASIKPPTLLLDGKFDENLDVARVRAMATAMPQAEFILMPDTGHYAPQRVPAEFNKIVLDFLKDK